MRNNSLSFLPAFAVLSLVCLAVELGTSCWAGEPPPFFGYLRSVAVSRDGSLFAAIEGDKIILTNTSTGRTEHTLKGCGCSVAEILVAPDDQTLVTWVDVYSNAGDDWEAKMWDIKTGRLRQVIKAPKVAPQQNPVAGAGSAPSETVLERSEAAGFTLNGLLATATHDNPFIYFWDIRTGRLMGTARQESFYFSSDGVVVPKTDTLKSIFRTFHWHSNEQDGSTLQFTTFSPDGHQLLTMSSMPNNGRIIAAALWDTDTGKQLRSFSLNGQTTYSASVGDGEVLIAGESFCQVWDLKRGTVRDLWKTPPFTSAPDIFGDTFLVWTHMTQNDREADVVAVRVVPYDHPPLWYTEKMQLVRYDILTGQRKRTHPIPVPL